MAKIHFSVFLVLGIVITIASWFNKSMRFFIIFGVAFTIYGLIGAFISKKPKKESLKEPKSKLKQILKKRDEPKFNSGYYKRCPNCGAIIPKVHRFCPYCGYGV